MFPVLAILWAWRPSYRQEALESEWEVLGLCTDQDAIARAYCILTKGERQWAAMGICTWELCNGIRVDEVDADDDPATIAAVESPAFIAHLRQQCIAPAVQAQLVAWCASPENYSGRESMEVSPCPPLNVPPKKRRKAPSSPQ